MTYNPYWLDRKSPETGSGLPSCREAATSFLLLVGLCSACSRQNSRENYDYVYPLKPEEGVFAYARIAPDGRHLAYASETRIGDSAGIAQTITVVDLSSRKIQFSEPGIDAYWSNDGQRMVFLSSALPVQSVSIRNVETGRIARNVAPVALGDYYSWGARDGRDLVLTIEGNYYFLNQDRAILPFHSIPACQGIGRGERPLLSKDGTRVSVFVNGSIMIRNLTDCDSVIDTGIEGAKADFSWDGRYVAFHTPKRDFSGYEIDVVDLVKRTVRTVTDLPGSSLFPSWTRDGRLCFRYDGDDYRGFVIERNVLSSPERPLRPRADQPIHQLTWSDIFPDTPRPHHRLNVVMVWATWSAHAPAALVDMQRARRWVDESKHDIGFVTALEIGSLSDDIVRRKRDSRISLPEIRIQPDRLKFIGAINQIPALVLFQDDRLQGYHLGALSYEGLKGWMSSLVPSLVARVGT